MDIFLRVVAIFVEVVILAGVMYALLTGVKLTALDLGVGERYKRMMTLLLGVVGLIVIVFFIVHLTAFYPMTGSQ
ncbi:hypothetical protein ACFLYX_01065 [Chloroflexota bacterium]